MKIATGEACRWVGRATLPILRRSPRDLAHVAFVKQASGTPACNACSAMRACLPARVLPIPCVACLTAARLEASQVKATCVLPHAAGQEPCCNSARLVRMWFEVFCGKVCNRACHRPRFHLSLAFAVGRARAREHGVGVFAGACARVCVRTCMVMRVCVRREDLQKKRDLHGEACGRVPI